jgi:succinate dehydrogenase / fumarate reductase flavoprotein subunit
MQGLADGYFVIPYTIGGYLAGIKPGDYSLDHAEVKKSIEDVKATNAKMFALKGKKTVSEIYRALGRVMWENVGMARSDASLKNALKEIPKLRQEFWTNVNISGEGGEMNQQLENAGRVADFLEFSELLCKDALAREESCGGHFRVEHQMPDGEAKRNDADFCYAAAWEFKGVGNEPELHKEPLKFDNVHLAVRSYK